MTFIFFRRKHVLKSSMKRNHTLIRYAGNRRARCARNLSIEKVYYKNTCLIIPRGYIPVISVTSATISGISNQCMVFPTFVLFAIMPSISWATALHEREEREREEDRERMRERERERKR